MQTVDAAGGLGRQEWFVAAVVFVVVFTTRVAFRTQMAYHGNGVRYALAITDFCVTRSQPRVPGYFLHVMSGRGMNVLVCKPRGSLVWTSMVASAGLAETVLMERPRQTFLIYKLRRSSA